MKIICPICNGYGETQQTDIDYDDCRKCNGTGKINKGMYYVIQENLFREYGFKALMEHLGRNNIDHEIVKYIPFSEKLEVKTNRKDVFFFGSSNAGMVAKKKYNWNPGHFINDNFTMENYLPAYKENMLNSDAKIMSIKEFKDMRTQDLKDGGVIIGFFARPLGDGKEFTGQTFNVEDWDEYTKDNSVLTEDVKILFAPIKTTQQEIRCWMIDGQPVTISQYKIGSRGNYLNMDHNDEAIIFARQMAKIYQPARAFCLDICLYDDEYKIVELGCINHCGFYDANMSKLIQGLENMVI